jgi:hypothetical protein
MERSGLTRQTVRKAIDQLSATKWYMNYDGTILDATYPKPPITIVNIPGDLLTFRNVDFQAKILYGILMAEKETKNQRLTFDYICKLTHWNIKTLKRAIAQLQTTGWLECERKNKLVPFQLKNYIVTYLNEVISNINELGLRGEALMREWLRLLSPSEDCIYNVRPLYLKNPKTGKRMEFDCFYFLQNVAIEFNGPQHYVPTNLYTQEQVDAQIERDNSKMETCKVRRVTSIIITPDDHTLEAMRQKIVDHLPLRDLQSYGPVIEYLEDESARYRKNSCSWPKSEVVQEQDDS